ncbi:hypothetical protein M422DRAFT_246895 [Sphaerobolus stellatus SS14]|nr:hypothetical protein M422DRAFT_246895 [Sphaerobolus stellatus SS14]
MAEEEYHYQSQEEDFWGLGPSNNLNESSPYSYISRELNQAEEQDWTMLARNRSSRPRIVSILVLEGLGSGLPVGAPAHRFEKDIRDLFDGLGKFGVQHGDLRYNNILEAPPYAENVVCPNHGYAHRWRLIDLTYFEVSDFAEHYIQKRHDYNLSNIFDEVFPPIDNKVLANRCTTWSTCSKRNRDLSSGRFVTLVICIS